MQRNAETAFMTFIARHAGSALARAACASRTPGSPREYCLVLLHEGILEGDHETVISAHEVRTTKPARGELMHEGSLEAERNVLTKYRRGHDNQPHGLNGSTRWHAIRRELLPNAFCNHRMNYTLRPALRRASWFGQLGQNGSSPGWL